MLFLWKAHTTEHLFNRVSSPGTHLTTDSTEAMRIKCLAQGHKILMRPRFEPSTSVSRSRYPNHMTNMLHNCILYNSSKALLYTLQQSHKIFIRTEQQVERLHDKTHDKEYILVSFSLQRLNCILDHCTYVHGLALS